MFALATAAWVASLLAARERPRLRPVHAALALYVGWAGVSLGLAAPPQPASGPAKLLGIGDARRAVRRHLRDDGAARHARRDRAARWRRRRS